MTLLVTTPNAPLPILKVQVCVLTFRRPGLLQSALESLRDQSIRNSEVLQSIERDHGMQVRMHVLVIDNDEAETGKGPVQAAMDAEEQTLRYVCEPRRGLSAARNRALTESFDMDLLAFLDDDETASPTWLENLLRCAWLDHADVVTGPVDPSYENSPAWIRLGGFFRAVRKPTGTSLTCAASNNTLLSASVFRTFRFDPRFDSTGGEDTDFFLRVSRAGHRIVWADEARVTETVPVSRSNAHWILRRAWSDANRYTLALCSVEASPKTIAYRLCVGCGGMLTGLLLLPTGIFGKQYAIRALQLVYRALGTFSALRGRSHSYYATSHG